MDINLDQAWSQFMLDQKTAVPVQAIRKHTDTPICDPISISTKTKIIYFNVEMDLFHRFWDFPMIKYDDHA